MSTFYDGLYALQYPPCPGGTIYIIRQGDTLFAIAQRFGTTVNALIAANPGINPLNLIVGQAICIPVPGPAPVPCPGFIYTIQPGDTYYLIALRYGTSVDALIRANPGVDPNRLQVGQRICVPVVAPPPVTPRTCTVALSPRISTVPSAGGVLWLRTDQFGTAQVLVAGVNLPDPSTIGVDTTYRAVFSWPGGTVSVPLTPVTGQPGVWVGTAVQSFPAVAFTSGAVDVFPGPVLGGFLRDCR
ncbi:MAG: LysM domain-containing protein [Firmicutes bacterium]|jgi:LysM repeat protein|nr:LysM domain-containing protein [Bacillota bacterium]MDD4336403.1 LysM domain-containing protein [Bacillota bacterium]MDD4792672.1 LysM domain-containing protein [Bacillota bacterium]